MEIPWGALKCFSKRFLSLKSCLRGHPCDFLRDRPWKSLGNVIRGVHMSQDILMARTKLFAFRLHIEFTRPPVRHPITKAVRDLWVYTVNEAGKVLCRLDKPHARTFRLLPPSDPPIPSLYCSNTSRPAVNLARPAAD